MTIDDGDQKPDAKAVGGVHGLRHKNCVKFFVLGSIARGIPRKDWAVQVKDVEVRDFAFYPRANVVVLAGNQNRETPWE
jgi:hypothetical protein